MGSNKLIVNRLIHAVVGISLIVVMLLVSGRGFADPVFPELVSKTNSGEPMANFIAGGCGSGATLSMSADARYVLFCSAALNLDPQRTDQNSNPLYVRDRVTNQTTLVSVNSDEIQENGSVVGAQLSGDGRHVLFSTDATNIDPRVANSPDGINRFNTYVRDLDQGVTTLVSEDSQGNLISAGQGGWISYDGDTVVFTGSDDLPIPVLEAVDLYVRKISSNHTAMITPGRTGGILSSDGNFVFFNKLIAPNHIQVARYEVNTQTTQEFFGVDAASVKGISEDGRYLVIVERDGSITGDVDLCAPSICGRIVRYDTLTGTAVLADVKDDGSDPDSWYDGDFSSMSTDGRFIAFYGLGSVGFTQDNFNQQGLFVRDLDLNRTVLVTRNSSGEPLDDGVMESWFAASDTEYVAYHSAGSTNSGFPPRQILLTQVYAEYQTPPEPQTFNLLPSADTDVRSGQQNRNFGGDQSMRLQSAGDNRALVRFDQGQLLTSVGNGEVLSAKLHLTITDNGNNWGTLGRTVGVHRLLQDWAEGNGTENDRGSGAGATWNCALDTNIQNILKNCVGASEWEMGQPNNPSVHPWVETASATQTVTNGQSGVVEYDVTTDVVAFKNGSADNYGWIIKKTNEFLPGQVSFGTKESPFAAELIITYQP